MSSIFSLFWKAASFLRTVSLLINVYSFFFFFFFFDDVFQIFSRSGMRPFSSYSSNSRDSSANDVYASGPELPPDVKKILFFVLLSPRLSVSFSSPPFASWRLGLHACVSSSTTSHFIWMQSEKGSKTASLALSCSFISFSNFFVYHTSSNVFESWWQALVRFCSQCQVLYDHVITPLV